MRLLEGVILLVVVITCRGQENIIQQTCRSDGTDAVIQNDATAFVGGILCNRPEIDIQAYEAFRYAFELLNKEKTILRGETLNHTYVPGIKLGMRVKNVCGNTEAAISAATEFYPQLSSQASSCSLSSPTKLFLGAIGTSDSGTSMDVAKYFERFNIPMISHAATAPALSDNTEYPSFMRTVPPDGPLMDVIIEVLQKINWKYLVVVYEDSAFGSASYEAVRSRLATAGICLTKAVRHASDDSVSDTLDQVIATDTTGVIFFGGPILATQILDQAETQTGAGKLQWIFTDSLSFNQDFQWKVYQRGVISIIATQRYIVEFEDHWVRIDENDPSPENPWFKAWYMEQNKCRLNGVNQPASLPVCQIQSERAKRLNFNQDPFVEPAVHAVFAYAYALREAQKAKCGPNFVGMCENLRNMTTQEFFNDYLKKVNFTYGKKERVSSLASDQYAPYFAAAKVKFDENGDIVNPAYDIWNYNDLTIGGSVGERFRRVGTYVGGRLNMNLDNIRMYSTDRQSPLPAIPSSPCPSTPCMPCLGVPPETKYVFIDGDIIVTGVFSIHKTGVSPLTCGQYDNGSRSGLQFMEGMIYALNQVVRQNMLPGVKLGGLAFDDCSSSILATTILSQVKQGSLVIKDSNGNRLDPRKLDVYQASQTSALTFPIAELMNTFKRPLVAYSSYDEDLLDYEYYTRMSYGVGGEFRAIVMMLKHLGFHYVQLVYTDHEYFIKGNKEFRKIAAAEGICVVTTIMAEADSGKTIDKLRMNRGVKAVVLNLGVTNNKDFLDGVKNRNASGEFALFGTHNFGKDEAVVKGREDAANGVISVGFKHSSLIDYTNYLKGLRVGTQSLINPWFTEWYQQIHQCYIGSTNPQGFVSPCNNIQTNDITNSTNFVLSYFTETNIHAIYVIAKAIDMTLSNICGVNYQGVCGEFQNDPNKGIKLLENIKKVSINAENADYIVRFNGKEVDQPFIFYNYDGQQFRQVAEYGDLNKQLDILGTVMFYNNKPATDYTSTCPGMCVQCFYMFQSQDYMYIDGDLIIPAMFDVHNKGTSPFACGALKSTNGFQYVEAFNFALNEINNGSSSVKLNNNLKLGGLAFDGCMNPRRALTITNAFQSSSIRFDNGKGSMIHTNKTLAWLSYDSQSTIDMSEILGSMGVPLVSPGATSPILDDKTRFNTFFRTIPSDSVVAKGMADLTNNLGFRYVMTLNAPDSGSRSTRDAYREYLKAYGICILSSYEFGTDGSNSLILNSMNQSSTHVVAVFAEPGMYIERFLQDKAAMYAGVKFVFISNRRFTVRTSAAVDRSFSFDMNTPTIAQFETYLRNRRQNDLVNNPWFREYFENKYNCQLSSILPTTVKPVCTNSDRSIIDSVFQQDMWVLSTINAVYSLAEGVHRTLMEKCSPDYTTICSKFRTDGDTYLRVMQNMDVMNFTDIRLAMFEFVERESNQAFSITQYYSGATRKAGDLINKIISYSDEANLKSEYRNVKSSCSDNCQVCSESSNNFQDFTYTWGNLYIIGLFDVHKKGATPYTCGELNDKHGFQLLEAFNYAVDYVNNKTGIFKDTLTGVRLGAIGLDVCQNPTRAGNLVTNIMSENINLQLADGSIISPKRFDVYVGPFDTDSSLRVADVLDAYSTTQITYGATSLELGDMSKYRYFLRTVPADDKQARAIVSYLKRFENNFVQIISTFDSVGIKGKEEFMRLAPLNKICVEKDIVVGYNGPITMNEANQALSQVLSNQSAKIVILFVDDPRVILQAADQNPDIRQNYFFIGTDKWGMDEDMLIGINRLIENRKAVTFDVETADVPGFDKYLQDKTPSNYKRNPWFKEYYERQFQCNVDATSTRYTQRCTQGMMGISRSPDYVQDPYVLYVINAVFSAALGIHKSLQELCSRRTQPGETPDLSYIGACSLFRNSGERKQRIYKGIKQAEFVDDTYQPFFFMETGESDRGYHIYEPKNIASRYSYDNVGSYNDSHYLKIDIRYDMNFVGQCTEGVDCPCIFPKDEPSRLMLKESPFDLNLVYVADVHLQSPTDPYKCGELASMSNFQTLLAFFYAINRVNNNERLSASLKLGGLAIDTCSNPMRIGQDIYSLLSGEGICQANSNGQIIAPSSIISFHALTTANSIPLSRMLTPYKIVSLSQGATSVRLSDKRAHPYFLRTVPPDDIQALVMLQVMKEFNWDYASIVVTNSAYGMTAYNTLIEKAALTNLKTCFGSAFTISSSTTLSQAEMIVEQLSVRAGSRVVILFTEPQHSRLLLQATKQKGLTGRFIWLASDYWANSMEIVEGYEEEAVGAITIKIRSEMVASFTNYVMSLSLTNRQGIPDDWFEEFYQRIHKCRLLTSKVRKEYPSVCNGDEKITNAMITQDPFVLHTIIAVYQIAESLNNIEACQSKRADISACLSLQANRRQLIYDTVLGTQFNVLPDVLNNNFTFKFTTEGYGDIGYSVLNFHRNITQDRYVYSQIGLYQQSLVLDRKLYRGVSILTAGVIPISTCPTTVTCSCIGVAGGAGAAGAAGAGYQVITGTGTGIVDMASMENTVTYQYARATSTSGYVIGSDGNYLDAKTGAILIVNGEVGGTDRFGDIWGIMVAALAAIGVFIALCLFIYLLVVYPVRSGTTILGFLLLIGIILMYLLVFAFIFHASTVVCGLRRFALGFVYALVYAVLFVKLVDIWRCRNKDEISAMKYSKIGTPLGLCFLVFMLVLVQVIINAEWLILQIPGVQTIYYNFFIWPLCTPIGYYDAGLIMSLIYVMLLIVLCVIFGFATFSCSRNHYESRWILGIAILSIPTWVIWCLVALLAGYKYRDAAVAVGLLLNATYMLLCSSLRKLYLLNRYVALIDEEERELEKERKSQAGSTYGGSVSGRHYDNAPQFHHGQGSVHGSVHGSMHGSLHGTRYAYSTVNSGRGGNGSRGVMYAVPASGSTRSGMRVNGGSSHGNVMLVQRGQARFVQEGGQGGVSSFVSGGEGGTMVVQQGGQGGSSNLYSDAEIAGDRMIVQGDEEMRAMVVDADNAGVSEGLYTEVRHPGGGVSVSEAFGGQSGGSQGKYTCTISDEKYSLKYV
ncbi:hypothetical protein SNE40_003935 [Patella caerulea]|uniref:G-protein coupled receptors family 3 profile domain-containing protein n=1 Tax=Patella caerulea TaxID=87958 RepID=A0AAN8KJC4_PATCE